MRHATRALPVFNALAALTTRERRDPDRTDDLFNQMCADAARVGDPLDAEGRAAIDDLRMLLHQYRQTPDLSPVGWKSATDLIGSRVANRYRVHRLQHDNPRILDERIDDPVFVIGLPRTATTLTHHILGKHRAARGPYLWEMYNITAQRPSEEDRERYINQTQKRMGMRTSVSRTLDDIHPLRAAWPEEHYFVLEQSLFHACSAPLPDYADWARTHDFRRDYRFLKSVLQILQHGREPRRWVLKHPGDLWAIDAILDVFPNATLVWTHRNPATVMGSWCSLVESIHSIHLWPRAVDTAGIGAAWNALLPEAMERARTARASIGRDRIIDVSYQRLAADPERYLADVLFPQLGFNWGLTDTENVDDAVNNHRMVRRHEYTLGRYGLTDTDVERAFGDYINVVGGLELS